MPRAARVLVVGAVQSRAAETAQVLSARGYRSVLSDPEEALVELLAARRPDVILFDRRGAHHNSKAATALDQFAAAVRDTVLWQQLPFLMLEEQENPDLANDALLLIDRLGGNPSEAEIDHRVAALARLGTMRAELARRLRTAKRVGISADVSVAAPGFVEQPHVLVAGVGLGLPKIQSALGGQATVFGVPTANLALDHLENFSVDLVCVDSTEDMSKALDTIAVMRRLPRWCALPIVATTDAVTTPETRKIIHDYGATDTIGLEEDDALSASRITVLIREHRYATAIQQAFRDIGEQLQQPETGLAGRDFALAHLMELIHDCDRHGDGFSAVGIQTHAAGPAAGAARAISGALTSMVRGEDLAVSLSPDLFMIMLPGTDGPQARIIRDRVSAVIGSTDFGVDEVGLPRIAPVSYAITAYHAGDTAETFVARLLKGFSPTDRPADPSLADELVGA